MIMESAVSTVWDGQLFYRGVDVRDLAETSTFEEVAELVWGGSCGSTWQTPAAWQGWLSEVGLLAPDSLPLERLMLTTAASAASDHTRARQDTGAVLRSARTLISALVDVLGEAPAASSDGIARRLTNQLVKSRRSKNVPDVMDAALVLVADHGLAAPTLTVRVSASVGSDFYAAILAGLCAMRGTKPGAAGLSVERLLDEAGRVGAEQALVSRHRSGELLPGSGHDLYQSDPRASEIIRRLRDSFGGTKRLDDVEAVIELYKSWDLPDPNMDFALGALTHVANLHSGASEAIFAIGRVAGWTAHYLEQRESPKIHRLREVYVGPMPDRRS